MKRRDWGDWMMAAISVVLTLNAVGFVALALVVVYRLWEEQPIPVTVGAWAVAAIGVSWIVIKALALRQRVEELEAEVARPMALGGRRQWLRQPDGG